MAITQSTQPYEFLCRWADGKLAGYHIKTLSVIQDGNKLLAAQESDAMNATVAQAAGFPLSDILKAIQTDALVAVDAAHAQLAAAVAEVEKAQAEVASLKATIDSLKVPVDA